MWWIRAAITEYILRSWSMVKLGTLAAQKKLFFSLNRIKRRLNILSDGNLDHEQAAAVAAKLEVSAGDVIDMDRRLASPDVSLNAPRSTMEGEGAEFMDLLVDETPSPEALAATRQEDRFRSGLLKQALASLPERERYILTERQLSEDPKTLEELGVHYGISRERVRQLEARALQRLQKTVLSLAAAASPGAEEQAATAA
jgi:RNA polymerase sigma-32 factor